MPYKENKNAYKIIHQAFNESLYGAVGIINLSTKSIKEEFIFDSIKNMTIHGRQKGDTKFIVECLSGRTQAILLMRKDETAASFHFKSRVLRNTGGTGAGPL